MHRIREKERKLGKAVAPETNGPGTPRSILFDRARLAYSAITQRLIGRLYIEFSSDEDCSYVVDVRERGAGHDKVVYGLKCRIAVVAHQRLTGIDPRSVDARKRIWRYQR